MTIRIDKKIIGYKVLSKDVEVERALGEDIKPDEKIIGLITEDEAKIHEKIKRPTQILGTTYRIKPNSGQYQHAYYLTLNHIEIKYKRFPFEIFINTQDSTHHQWISILTRMVSAVFRKGGDTSFIVQEFKAICGPAGSYWGNHYNPNISKDKKVQYNSIVHEIGCILENWLNELEEYNNLTDCKQFAEMSEVNETYVESKIDEIKGQLCPECRSESMFIMDGCLTCTSCGYSKCG